MTAATADKFELAYVFVAVCCAFSLGRWLTSDLLHKRLPVGTLHLPRGGHYRGSMREYRAWQYGISVLLLCLFAACAYGVYRVQMAKELEALEDWLYPASDPDPPCSTMFPLPNNAIALYLGNSRLVAGKRVSMWSVINPQDRRIATPLLIVEHDADRVALDLDVRGKDGKIIARIRRNYFVINQNNILTKKRPDRSTLIVTDQDGTEVLKVRYLNLHAIHLLGTFYVIGQKEPIVIKEMTQNMGHYQISGACNASDGWPDDVAMSLSAGGDGTGNHEYDPPGSKERPLSPVRKWNPANGEWEHEFRNVTSR